MQNKVIELSSKFKSQATKAIISIILFAIIYVLILALAIGLTVACVSAGVMLIAIRPMFLTIALGIGLASLGILVLVFLVKFCFKSHKVDRSHLVEVKRDEEPRLFGLIDEIVAQVDTSFPKKVYLSADVNAAVFYDSSFWSMFLPVKKNLQIGLGLVNSVTEGEFKAVLSHEFGHFSQKTMKVGSYIYNLNQVIFNMLFDNEGYEKLIRNWASISGFFALFVGLAVKIIEGIQWILKELYGFLNKSYLGLSREMEFHADEIAASITGYEPLAKSLLRLKLSDHAYNDVLAYYDGKIPENITSENLYRNQSFVINFLATNSQLNFVNGLPDVSLEVLNKFNKSKLVIKDQWASHPSTEERIARLKNKNAPLINALNGSAKHVFVDFEKVQKQLTDQVFKEVKYDGEVILESPAEFETAYKNEIERNSFSKIYNGYYDDKNPIQFELDAVNLSNEELEFGVLFSEEKIDMVYTEIALKNDIEILKKVALSLLPIKTFDYDGLKYKRKECNALLKKLFKQEEELHASIELNDIKIFKFFSQLEMMGTTYGKLKKLYQSFFDYDTNFDNKIQITTKLNDQLVFINATTPYEEIERNFWEIEPTEALLKDAIKEILLESKFKEEVSDAMQNNFDLYLSKKWKYFDGQNYLEPNLEMLVTALRNYAYLLSKGYFLLKKELLDYQESLLVKIR